ncbi:F-box/kelch-repeat protein At3g23880-like [Vicia villosa]|uniref:F-box/kelch-repeat protein At3g23880-like n=1 Tax=Vicia villosa TaxID=3911 RepID=UPI00273B4C72|nr:F-box/kelch-repeat protein At3g23880-like [Vicia villosa]
MESHVERRFGRTNPNPNMMSCSSLPFDLIPDILSRLPVKFLLQLQCVCKSWNSLISDHQFVRKHLNRSNTHNLHCLRRPNCYSHHYTIQSNPLRSVFTRINPNFTSLIFPSYGIHERVKFELIGSCDGILCLADYCLHLVILWNPSVKKGKELPLLERTRDVSFTSIGFGYDSLADTYKVIVINKTKGKVHTLGTNFWKSIPDFPSDGLPVERKGRFVSGSGTINWLTTYFIVSFDLRKESYQKIFLPPVVNARRLFLGVMRDSLCIIANSDIWIIKEYGNEESWTKLFTIDKHLIRCYTIVDILCSFEDDQVLIKAKGPM